LLIILSGCSSRIVTEIRYTSIPEEFLQCNLLADPAISDQAFDEALINDYKLLAVELAQVRLEDEIVNNECVRNAKAALEHQKRMLNKT
jgi:hypothetical protein